nr:hypothetical protein [Paenibacillus fonticola]
MKWLGYRLVTLIFIMWLAMEFGEHFTGGTYPIIEIHLNKTFT